MQIENLITKRSRLDRRFKLTKDLGRWFNRYTRASALYGLIIGSLIGCYIADNPNKTQNTSPKPLETKIEVKEVQAADPEEKDWSADLVGYFRHRGQEIGYNDFDITKLHQVMDCENGLHTADRKNYLYDGENGRYTTAGFGMITNSTWRQHKCTGSKWNGVDNINCVYKIVGKNGLNDYRESKHCWGKHFNEHSIRYIQLWPQSKSPKS